MTSIIVVIVLLLPLGIKGISRLISTNAVLQWTRSQAPKVTCTQPPPIPNWRDTVNTNNVQIRYILAGLVLAIFVLLSGALVSSNVTYDGYYVPNNLATLAPPAPGAEPVEIERMCFPEEQVTDATRQEIQTKTGAAAETCDYRATDAFDGDTYLGVFAWLVVLVAIGAIFALFQWNERVGAATAAIAVLVSFIAGAFLGDWFRDRLTDWGVVAALFWRGFGAAAALTVGFAIHYWICDNDND